MLARRLSALRDGAYRRTRRILRAVDVRFLLPQRAENAYATHLPILIGIAQLVRPRKVLEFGCGLFSTTAFLARTCFPDLEQLDSYETDPEWWERIGKVVANDPRISLRLVEEPMSSAVRHIDFADYDLVFIDDSLSVAERCTTIAEVARHCSPTNVVVLHDYENKMYLNAARSFRNHFRFTALNPNTGIVWNEAPISKSGLRHLNRLIRRHSQHLDPADIQGWMRVLSDSPRG